MWYLRWYTFDYIWIVYGPFFVTVNPDDIVRPILVKIPVENSSLVLLIRCMPIFWIVHLVPWAGPLMAHSGTRYFVIHVSSNRAYSEMDVHSTTASLGFSFHVLLARFPSLNQNVGRLWPVFRHCGPLWHFWTTFSKNSGSELISGSFDMLHAYVVVYTLGVIKLDQ